MLQLKTFDETQPMFSLTFAAASNQVRLFKLKNMYDIKYFFFTDLFVYRFMVGFDDQVQEEISNLIK